jgi:hypothetical protein
MILEKLDIILLVTGGALIIVSFIINILSTIKISRFSESLDRLEHNFKATTANPRGREATAPAGTRAAARAYDSSILPAVEKRPSDSHRKTRYRPPGSSAASSKENVILTDSSLARISSSGEEAPVSDTSPLDKSATRAPSDQAASREKPEPSKAEEKSAPITSEPISEISDKKPPLDSGELADDARQLVKDYLGDSSDLINKKAGTPSEGADSREISKGSKQKGADDVMEVVEAPKQLDTAKPKPESPKQPDTAKPKPESPKQPDTAKPKPKRPKELDTAKPKSGGATVEINPFEKRHQKIDFIKIFRQLDDMKPGGSLILNFQDILFLVKKEINTLNDIYIKAFDKNVTLSLKNTSSDLRNEVLSKITNIDFIS